MSMTNDEARSDNVRESESPWLGLSTTAYIDCPGPTRELSQLAGGGSTAYLGTAHVLVTDGRMEHVDDNASSTRIGHATVSYKATLFPPRISNR
jgi:hypothetical protein